MIWRLSRATPLGSCSATVSSVSRNGYRSFRTSSCFFRDSEQTRRGPSPSATRRRRNYGRRSASRTSHCPCTARPSKQPTMIRSPAQPRCARRQLRQLMPISTPPREGHTGTPSRTSPSSPTLRHLYWRQHRAPTSWRPRATSTSRLHRHAATPTATSYPPLEWESSRSHRHRQRTHTRLRHWVAQSSCVRLRRSAAAAAPLLLPRTTAAAAARPRSLNRWLRHRRPRTAAAAVSPLLPRTTAAAATALRYLSLTPATRRPRRRSFTRGSARRRGLAGSTYRLVPRRCFTRACIRRPCMALLTRQRCQPPLASLTTTSTSRTRPTR